MSEQTEPMTIANGGRNPPRQPGERATAEPQQDTQTLAPDAPAPDTSEE